eukprot:scaffold673527_cov75-Prasinocladus_malaysianus.AAC.1
MERVYWKQARMQWNGMKRNCKWSVDEFRMVARMQWVAGTCCKNAMDCRAMLQDNRIQCNTHQWKGMKQNTMVQAMRKESSK